jgi:uncharacterized UBP type Zn finger protein
VTDICSHLDEIFDPEGASGTGCVECLRDGGTWMHLRRCLECGHIGCCDQSPGKHATAHFHEVAHPLLQSFEPDEDWVYCYVDDVMFEIDSMRDSPSHP